MNKILIFILAIMAIAIGYLAFQRLTLPESRPVMENIGQCGDSICDEFERANPDACPKDCLPIKPARPAPKPESGKFSSSSSSVKKAINPASSSSSVSSAKAVTSSSPSSPVSVSTVGAAVAEIDFDKSLGAFGPYIFGTTIDPSGYSLTKEAGFKWVGVSTSPVVPADPSDSSGYNFKDLDKEASLAVNAGVEPEITFSPEAKPKNLDDYAVYVKNTAKHLTQGWGNGYNWNIKLFRFGNEPDNAMFWKGTKEEVFQTYAVWAKALKSVDSNFILSAPGLMMIRDGSSSDFFQKEKLNPWITEFLKYIKDNNAPLDILTFHGYSPFLLNYFSENFRLMKAELEKYPNLSPLYGVPKLGNDEWNIMLGDAWRGGEYLEVFDTAWVASHNISALIKMVENSLVLSARFGGTFNGEGQTCHDFPLLSCKSEGKPVYYAFKAFNQLYGKNRVVVETKNSKDANFAAIAGKNEKEIIVIVSNYDTKKFLDKYEAKTIKVPEGTVPSPSWKEYDYHVSKNGAPQVYEKFVLNFKNLPSVSGGNITYEHYIVDDSSKLSLAEKKDLSAEKTVSISAEMSAPSVHLIKLKF